MADKKVLIVDDELAIRELLAKTVKISGYQPVTAGSGEEALELLRHEEIQLIFIDLKLPGINGMELCRRIRRDMPKARLFAMTGFRDEFEQLECLKAGFNDYFFKPLDLRLILQVTAKAFEKP